MLPVNQGKISKTPALYRQVIYTTDLGFKKEHLSLQPADLCYEKQIYDVILCISEERFSKPFRASL